jgi:polyisoprenoid-binding protein YceI
MKKYLKGLAFIAMIGIANIGYAQAKYKIQETNDVAIKLTGTSSVHDWEMDANKAEGEAEFLFKTGTNGELQSVESLTFALAVKDLQSDSKGLDKNAYEALKANKFNTIQYKLSSSTFSSEKGGRLLKTKGKLTIAGVTNDIIMNVHLVVNKNGSVTFKGSYKLNMSDYNVDPPTYMFGTIKTGNVITLDFSAVYKISK